MLAFTLRSARNEWRRGNDIVEPIRSERVDSKSRGIGLDESYDKFVVVLVGKTWIGDGLAEEMSLMAEQVQVYECYLCHTVCSSSKCMFSVITHTPENSITNIGHRIDSCLMLIIIVVIRVPVIFL